MEISDNLINLRVGYNEYSQVINKVKKYKVPFDRHKHLHKIIRRSMIIREIKEITLAIMTFVGMFLIMIIVFGLGN